MIELWLVRHGETPWSREGRLTGWTDLPLTSRGEDQARELGAWLSPQQFDAVFASDLQRALGTARLAYGEPLVEPKLRELNFGELEGAAWEGLEAHHKNALLTFDSFQAPGGESTQQLTDRLNGFLDQLEPGRYLVFAHGGPIRALLRQAGQDRLVAPCTVVALNWTLRQPLLIHGKEHTNGH